MEVAIQNLAFTPAALTVEVGTIVRWVNRDTPPHTTTSDTGVWDSSILRPGQSFAFTFEQAGTFAYHCDIHPTMKATITVVTAATAPPHATPPPGPFADPAFRELWARTDAAPSFTRLGPALSDSTGGVSRRRAARRAMLTRGAWNQPSGGPALASWQWS
jgi:hypothetical protein